MKRVESGKNGDNGKVVAKSDPPAPPPLPSFLRYSSTQKAGFKSVIADDSITKRHIARYWELKCKVEQDHFNAAIEAAARLEADKLKDNNCKGPEESLSYYVDNKKENKQIIFVDPNMEEFRKGIKDWWMKSNYAYLNQPDIDHAGVPEPSSYVPQSCY